ncbi:MAG: hypothetical protein PHF29_08385 [Candidatus Riflebacteria bacterium]|nr:hypothetical protein [Candidatus Riflebacteria bacterium]
MKFSRADKFDKRIAKLIKKLYQDNKGIITEDLSDAYLKSAEDEYQHMEELGVALSVGLIAALPVKETVVAPMGGVPWTDRLNKNKGDLAYNISTQTRAGLQAELSYKQAVEALKNINDKDYKKNVNMAEIEAGRVKSYGQTDVLDVANKKVALEKTWRTMKDERVRRFSKGDPADHVKMEGVTISYEQDFKTPIGSYGKWPRQMKGPNSFLDNAGCRCIATVSIKE